MKKADKHYKFINSKTGNTIHYHSLKSDIDPEKAKAELQRVKEEVAIKNGIFLETVYWEEIKENS